jgi:hypothetical protein
VVAEKIRAALTRREVAIRDFFDIDYISRLSDIRLDDPRLLDLVTLKLASAGNDPIDTSPSRFEALRAQIDFGLRPVLRTKDHMGFDIERAWEIAVTVSRRLPSPSLVPIPNPLSGGFDRGPSR